MLEDLEEALEEQKMKGAEKDTVEVIARALQLDPATVTRVILAYQTTKKDKNLYGSLLHTYIPEEVQDAIVHAIENGLRRLAIRGAIKWSKTLSIERHHLIPDNDPQKVCDGCPESLTCIAGNEHSPKDCLHNATVVFPLRFVDPTHVEIECTQPAGKYIVPLHAFPPTTRGDL